MKHMNNPLTYAIRGALLVGLTAVLNPAVAQDSEGEQTETEDRIQVTGSRIKRADLDGALPVTVIDRETIELSGESNAADLIRQIPLNTSGSFRPQSGSSAQSTASVDLRGLGSSRSLVLINGRRMPKAPLTGTESDLNMIPLGAIERIEVLSDGASAIYGSDAIGGVVNVILREDFEGAEIMAGMQEVNPKGGDRREASLVFGASSDRSRLIGGASYNSRDIIFARDFFFNEPGNSIYGNNFTTLTGPFDDFNWTALPGACNFSNQPAFFLAPNVNSLTGQQCSYDFTRVSADEASIQNQSMFLRASHDISDDWTVFSDMWIGKTRSFGRYAPVPDSTYFSTPLTINSPNNPTNPDSPLYDPALGLDPQQVNVWHRFDALGNRDNYVDSELYDLLLGVEGSIGAFDVEAGARWTKNKVFDIGYNYLVRSNASAFLESGIYSLADPFGAPDDVLNAMKATISRISKFDQREFFALASTDFGEFNNSPISWFFGAEYREEVYDDQYDSLSEAGQIGGSAGNSAGGERNVTSVFGEVLVPLTDRIELSIAARSDDYSDYGSDFSPKVSLRYDVMDGVAFRGSWGEGFRAPDLPILTAKESFSADSITDPQTCAGTGNPPGCSIQVNAFRIANPNLASEQSEQFALGVVLEPTDWFSATIDYTNIKITDQIAFYSSQSLINRELAGDAIPPGLGVTRAPNGTIVRIDTGYGNEGTINTSFFDFSLNADYDIGYFSISNSLNAVKLQTQSADGSRQFVRDPGVPRWRAVLSNSATYGDFVLAYNLNYISGQFDRIIGGEGTGRVPSYTTHDVQLNYFTPWDGRVTIGARNVWNRQPPIGLGDIDVRSYDFELYDAYGRTPYIRYTQTF